jgi:hypothetical protein
VHALLVNLTIDPDESPTVVDALVYQILPRIRGASGLIASHWLEPADGDGYAVVVFETKAQARAAARAVRHWKFPGISIEDIEFRRVATAA